MEFKNEQSDLAEWSERELNLPAKNVFAEKSF